MKKNSMNTVVRILIAVCGIALFAVNFLPIWRIDLDAPQYPEGLRMLIYANKLGGDVEIINGLNHYIGMKTLHAKDFIEFSVLIYIISAFAFLFLLVAIIGKRKLLYTLFALFAAFGILAMVDFWRWEYNYGHNLNPNAAIIVPGMAYQPPLIGFKQLLNFGAYSIPDIGGWIFIAVGVLSLIAVLVEVRAAAKIKKNGNGITTVALLLFSTPLFTSCNVQPKPIKLSIDQCDNCKMSISDPRFPAEIITKKGKIFIFDDIYCLLEYLKENEDTKKSVKEVYLSDYLDAHEFIKAEVAHLYRSEEIHSPMGGNTAAFTSEENKKNTVKDFKGESVSWKNLLVD
ncbi:MAG TPA: nitrous oxide reductase accessory protein NosL [Chitinophagales bacterium]|nr:nitrous oxide reductase accessory protein NosL [Chitinophagales bacterium]